MAGENQDTNIWPKSSFYFSVQMGSLTGSFQEVSGMDNETQPIEYRHSNSPEYSTAKMPGIAKYGNVIMKRGIFVTDQTFWNWYGQVAMNTMPKTTVIIKLLDQQGAATMQWTLNNAMVTKVTAPDMKSEGNEVAIESLEIAYETLVIATE